MGRRRDCLLGGCSWRKLGLVRCSFFLFGFVGGRWGEGDRVAPL